jgi:hypothetical protein
MSGGGAPAFGTPGYSPAAAPVPDAAAPAAAAGKDEIAKLLEDARGALAGTGDGPAAAAEAVIRAVELLAGL